MNSPRVLATLLLAVVLLPALLLGGCASTGGTSSGTVHPGETVSFKGEQFLLLTVQEDFVLLRYRDPDADDGVISGFVDEVFRVSRYDLGKGRWYGSSRLPGVYIQWRGLDAFALESDPAALGGAEVVMVR
ncbi:MAG: hypothetical protein HUU06_01625 [Planctomycetaceae bacterium]|nr:hypothetical protein [Planctomycetota bacterium]NUN51473.1 hypothetical protein [Planctomycetaceae bacterium]